MISNTMNNNNSFFSKLSCIILIAAFTSCNSTEKTADNKTDSSKTTTATEDQKIDYTAKNAIDTAKYNKLMLDLANGDTSGKWPVKGPYPLPGAILPFHRVVAFYGNLHSKRMGILGELPKAEMFAKLKSEVANWQKADTTIPVIPALHYIAMTAQGAPGSDGKYRLRMGFNQIDTILSWAKEINALVFLDVQVGHSDIRVEAPTLEKYLSLPNVHFGIDPEFSMKGGEVPGRRIGTYDAADINATIDYLASIVKKNNLPPKILVIHRFTERMVTNYRNIKRVPEVQVVIDMDGWGDKILKTSSYLAYVKRDPVQFAGFKLFYKNDIKKDPNGMFTPPELLKFLPKPIYIQYQ
jgi:hypothetical protein